MARSAPASAVVVRVSVPRSVAALRGRWDHVAGLGVPAHVTLIYPFVPATALDRTVRRTLATIATGLEPFSVTFASVGRFRGVVYLAPTPTDPFIGLTHALTGRFPDHPPYGGAYDEVVPHLTIADAIDAPLDTIALDAARLLPFRRQIRALEVLVPDAAGHWHRRWRLPLGVRP